MNTQMGRGSVTMEAIYFANRYDGRYRLMTRAHDAIVGEIRVIHKHKLTLTLHSVDHGTREVDGGAHHKSPRADARSMALP